jgi:hypothetical protein
MTVPPVFEVALYTDSAEISQMGFNLLVQRQPQLAQVGSGKWLWHPRWSMPLDDLRLLGYVIVAGSII